MASSPNESQTLFSYLEFDDDADYGSDTNVHGDERTLSHSPVPEVRPLSALNPLVKRNDTTAPETQHHTTDAGGNIIITNPIDEQQELIL